MSLGNTVGRMRSLLACGLIFMAAPVLAQTLDKPSLFEEAVVFSQPDINKNALRSRSVIITDTSFTGSGSLQSRSSDNGIGQTAPVGSLTLNLFDDVVVDVDLTNAYQNRSGSQTWVGKVQTGTVEGTAAFVIRDGQVYGAIDVPGHGNFTIRPGEFNSHIIEQTDGSQILTGETDIAIAKTNTSSGNIQLRGSSLSDPMALGAVVGASNDDGSIIDVYVGYDQDASGGSVVPATAQSLAELFIAYTNQAYENSGITQRVWLVGGVDGFDFTATGDQGIDLAKAKDNGIAGLHDKRDEHHADLVMFFRPHTTGSTSCVGLGYLQELNNDTSWGDNAFSIMQACSFGSEVFAHELGHNMGGIHDWYVQAGTTPQTYAHGYVDLANKFKTIMSYSNRCILEGGGSNCTSLSQFSNPSLSYNGNLTGVAAGTSTSCIAGVNPGTDCDADNTRNFNEKAPTTAKFRDSQVIWTGTVDNVWSKAGNWSTNQGKPSAPTAAGVVPRSYDNVLIPAGVANYPTITTGAALARELTIEDGATLTMSDGTLTVSWAWEDAGGFTATGGTVKLVGPIGVTLTSSGSFNNLEIGSGADTTQVTLESNIDVNGDFTVKAGASFAAGANQINIAGNISDQVNGFQAGTSTVVFDSATTQIVEKSTTQSLLNETFSGATGGCCGNTYYPAGWAHSADAGDGFLTGVQVGTNGIAVSWNTSSDTWLITAAVQLSSKANYTLGLDYRKLNSSGSTNSVTAYYGSAQDSSSLTTSIGAITGDASLTTSFQNGQFQFTVPADGTYYIGFNVKSASSYTILDNIKLDGVSLLQFNNVKVVSGETDFLEASEIGGYLEVSADAILDLGANSTTVEGTVTNNGEIKQTLDAVAATNTAFVSIKNKAGSTEKYLGVELNPTTSLGSTVVSVKGNQACNADTGYVNRCFIITPTTAGTAAIKFYYRNAELNGNTSPIIKSLSGTDWTELSTTISRGGAGDITWVNGAAIAVNASNIVGLDDTVVLDIVPDAFNFTDSTAVVVSSTQTSNVITVSGINSDSPISITGGSYKINSDAYTTAVGTVSSGDTVTVRHTASSAFSTAVDTVLDIGGETDTYTSTTEAADTVPTVFAFVDATGVALGSTQTSASITVQGINTTAAISIIGGTYSLDGGAYTTAVGTVSSGDTVTVRHSASAALGTAVNTVLNIGGVTDTYTSTTIGPDTTPDAFVFTAVTEVPLGSTQTSGQITVSGINTDAAISVTGGSYSLNGGAYTSAAGTVADSQTVTLQHTAGASLGAVVNTVLTIGGETATYTSTTVAPDLTPDAFAFTDVTGVLLSSTQTSNSINVAGINTDAAISIVGGTYSLNGGPETSVAGTVNAGDAVTVQHTASSEPGAMTNTVLTIGTESDTYSSTTIGPDTTPIAFTFTDVTEVALGSTQTSDVITVTGINTASAISATGGSYSINSGAYTSSAGTVVNGDTVTLQHTASGALGTAVDTVLTIGGVSDTYTSTTEVPDTAPDSFAFTDVNNVGLSSTQTSNVITVAGINTAAAITVTGGSYKVNAGSFTTIAGTVNSGDTVTVQHTASATPLTAVDTVLTIGGVSDTYTSTSEAPDTAPNTFAFTDVTGVALGSTQTSNIITVLGINTAAPISITGGSYKINTGSYTTYAGTVNSGDTVTVQHTASAATSTAVDTVLSIGGESDTFTSTTETPDTLPNAFVFIDVTDAALSSEFTSNTITVAGTNTAAPVSITGGTYSLNGGAYTSAAGTISSDDTVSVKHTTSTAFSTSVDTVLNIGGVTDTYTSTTEAADTAPDAFTLVDVTDVALASTQTSNQIAVAGINSSAAISVTGGTYSINGGAYTSAAGTVVDGNTVTVRHTASAALSGVVNTILDIGGVTDTYTTTTVAPDLTPETFAFADVTGVVLSSTQTSNSINVAGINTDAAISVVGGTYSLNGGPETSVAGTVNAGDAVTVQHTASSEPGAMTNTVLTIGTESDTYSSTTIGPDTTPIAFTFTDVTEVALGSTQTSDVITVTGINTASAISATGGSYSINSGAYTSSAGTVVNGDTVTLQHTASGALGTAVDTVLTIGGVSDTYTSTTEVPDTAPDSFAFTDVNNVGLSSTQTSNVITVAGINTAAAITVTGGSYKVNAGSFTTIAGTVNSGDTVTVQHTASATPLTAVETVLTIGGVSDTYTSTSEAPDTVPEIFTFTDTTGEGGATQTSTSIIVTGINTATPIGVTGGGSYNINGGDYISTAGIVNSGDTVTLQHTLAAADASTTDTVLDIGGVTDTYTSTTVLASTITPTDLVFPSPASETVQSGTLIASAGIAVSGLISATAPISVTVGEYSINGGPFTSEPGNVKNGDTVVLRHNASSAAGGVVTTTVQIGAVSTTFITKTVDVVTGTASSGGGSMGAVSLMFLSVFTLLGVVRRRRFVIES